MVGIHGLGKRTDVSRRRNITFILSEEVQRVGSGAGTDTGWIMGCRWQEFHLRASVSSVKYKQTPAAGEG